MKVHYTPYVNESWYEGIMRDTIVTACGRDLNKWKGRVSPVWEDDKEVFFNDWAKYDRCKTCEKAIEAL